MEPIIGLAVLATAFAIGSAALAARRHRDALPWLVYGAILGPVAIVILLVAPPGACPTCGMRVIGFLSTCVRCGRPVRGKQPAPVEEEGVPQTARPLEDWLHGMPSDQAHYGPNGAHPAGAAHGANGTPNQWLGANSPNARPRPNLQVLASAVYVGGSVLLEVGRRYEIARHDGIMTVLGPVDSEPGKVQVERSLEWLAVTNVNGRLVISDESDRRSMFSLVFERIAGMTGEALEASLRPDVVLQRPA